MKLKDTVKRWLVSQQDKAYDREYQSRIIQARYENAIAAWEGKEAAASQEVPEVRIIFYSDVSAMRHNPVWPECIYVFVSERGRLHETAVSRIQAVFAKNPKLLLLYGDEDVWEEGSGRKSPWLKPDWSPDLYAQYFYFGSVAAIRGKAFMEGEAAGDICCLCTSVLIKAGGFERVEAGRQAAFPIAHMNGILFHAQTEKQQTAYINGEYPFCKERKVFKNQTVQNAVSKVSVIIPSKDNPSMLKENIEALIRTVDKIEYEIIIVDNGSSDRNRAKTEELKQELIKLGRTVKYLYFPMPFHFSKMCNMGAKEAEGELLLFLNDDVEAFQTGWMEKMAAAAARSHAGAAGAKLLYPDTTKIQHAGIVNLPMGPVHKLQFVEDTKAHYFARNIVTHNVLAVTGACLMLRKQIFEEAGGFTESLPVAFNDVDLCFTLYEKGYYNIQVNEAVLYHHESVSRGNDEAEDKLQRLMQERELLYTRHAVLHGKDPFYHIWLNRQTLDTRIIPVCGSEETGHESVSAAIIRRCPDKLRKHPGLMIRIESGVGQYLQGYIVVLGDNNACYDKKLALLRVEESETAWAVPAKEEETLTCIEGSLWTVGFVPVTRLDLQENMPDQSRVALSGFQVLVQGIPTGRYHIGAIAHNRVTGVTLLNWSNNIFTPTSQHTGIMQEMREI